MWYIVFYVDTNVPAGDQSVMLRVITGGEWSSVSGISEPTGCDRQC
jgi:hypothetical protein